MKLKKIGVNFLDHLFARLLSERAKNRIEVTILVIAIASFIVHLLLIALVDVGMLVVNDSSNLVKNPIAAIYTPFSFILIYEVYLLIYYLPKSITVYIGKQYEIVTLVLIRRLFKDLSHLKLTSEWFSERGDLLFTYDLIATILLFYLISVFYSLNPQKDVSVASKNELSDNTTLFIRMKNFIAVLLVPVFVVIASYSLVTWVHRSFFATGAPSVGTERIDGIFFDQFFTILILADVLLLLDCGHFAVDEQLS